VSTPLDDSERRALREKARKATLDALRTLGGEARRDAIRKWALTHDYFTSRELAAPAPEAAAHKYRRAVDHALSWTLTNLKNVGRVEKPRWGTWRLTDAVPPDASAAEPVTVSLLRRLFARRDPTRGREQSDVGDVQAGPL
jgi:hypothetical protein